MEYTIFYSWQSDTPRQTNKDFVREALEQALLTKKPTIEDRASIESGMERVPGTPEVATVMFEKIRRSSIFVADVTLVGTIDKSDRKPKRTANPNVLLEMGFAAGTMGWNRIICLMNEHFGKREDQAIDVRNRRYPINYTLEPEHERNKAKREHIKKELVSDLQMAIEALEIAEHHAVQVAIESLDFECMKLIASYGRRTWIDASHPANMGELVNSLLAMAAIQRLLDLRLLMAQCDPHTWRGAYHWTYFGKLALVKLQMRSHVDDTGDLPPAPLLPITMNTTTSF